MHDNAASPAAERGVVGRLAPEVFAGLGALARVSRALVGTGSLAELAERALGEMRAALDLELAVLYLPAAGDGGPCLDRFVCSAAAGTGARRARRAALRARGVAARGGERDADRAARGGRLARAEPVHAAGARLVRAAARLRPPRHGRRRGRGGVRPDRARPGQRDRARAARRAAQRRDHDGAAAPAAAARGDGAGAPQPRRRRARRARAGPRRRAARAGAARRGRHRRGDGAREPRAAARRRSPAPTGSCARASRTCARRRRSAACARPSRRPSSASSAAACRCG